MCPAPSGNRAPFTSQRYMVGGELLAFNRIPPSRLYMATLGSAVVDETASHTRPDQPNWTTRFIFVMLKHFQPVEWRNYTKLMGCQQSCGANWTSIPWCMCARQHLTLPDRLIRRFRLQVCGPYSDPNSTFGMPPRWGPSHVSNPLAPACIACTFIVMPNGRVHLDTPFTKDPYCCQVFVTVGIVMPSSRS
jgi:hypothetical protein